MPVNWRPDIPLKVFIKNNRIEQRPSASRAKNRKVFNCTKTLPVLKMRPTAGSTRVVYEIEGTLEIQRMLLHKLATQENIVKGLSMYQSQSTRSISKADLEQRIQASQFKQLGIVAGNSNMTTITLRTRRASLKLCINNVTYCGCFRRSGAPLTYKLRLHCRIRAQFTKSLLL